MSGELRVWLLTKLDAIESGYNSKVVRGCTCIMLLTV
jgi:hypothetical protein